MRTWGTALTLAAIALAGAADPADAGRAILLRSEGDLVSTTGGAAAGMFAVLSAVRKSGRERSFVWIDATQLDVTRTATGGLPRYDAFVIPVVGDEVRLGRVRVNRRERGRLHLRRVERLFTAPGSGVRAQAGATLEVRGPAGVVLRGTLPAFEVARDGRSAATSEVYGRFVALLAPFNAPGSYRFRTDEYENGEVRNRLVVRAPGLLTGANTSVYRVRVINAAGNRFVELGEMTREPRTGASLQLDTRRAALPSGIVRWSEFNGGLIEVRIGGSVRLRGDIAPLAGVDQDIPPVGHARSAATIQLTSTGGRGIGVLTVAVEQFPNRRTQRLRVRVVDLPRAGAPYTMVATAPSGTRTTLGTFATRSPSGAGGFGIDTRRGRHPPGFNAVRLGGQTVEVLDRGGAAVLTGTFPDLGSD